MHRPSPSIEIHRYISEVRGKGNDGGYKLSELLSGRGGNANAVVNVATVKFRFGTVVLTEKSVFDKTYEKIGVAGSHFGTHGYTISLFVIVATECKVSEC